VAATQPGAHSGGPLHGRAADAHPELRDIRRGRRWRTTITEPTASRPADQAGRRFDPPAPYVFWVADFTCCPTWSRMVYVAFVIDAYSRWVLGWCAATSMT
jgi:putative transposase